VQLGSVRLLKVIKRQYPQDCGQFNVCFSFVAATQQEGASIILVLYSVVTDDLAFPYDDPSLPSIRHMSVDELLSFFEGFE
jgi:hypothetical protein